jgi:hypothetical protein
MNVAVGTPLTLERALPIIDAAGILGIPVLIRGGSGIGKSSTLAHLSSVRDEHLEVVTANLYEPQDFGGQPIVVGEEFRLAPMPWVRRVLASDKPVRVFFDELDKAPQPTQLALLRLLLDRVCGDVDLPQDARFVAAINLGGVSNGGWEMPGSLANRFIHLDVVADAQDWVDGMLTGWTSAPDRVTSTQPSEEGIRDARAKVIAFISANHDLLNQEPTDPTLAAGAWPSSRKWDWVSRILPYIPHEADLVLRTVEGLVGRAAATAFFAWVEATELPDIDVILDPASGIDWASEPAERVRAMLTAAVSVAGDSTTRYENVGDVLAAAMAAERTDIAASVAKAYFTAAPEGATRNVALLSAFAPLLSRAGMLK